MWLWKLNYFHFKVQLICNSFYVIICLSSMGSFQWKEYGIFHILKKFNHKAEEVFLIGNFPKSNKLKRYTNVSVSASVYILHIKHLNQSQSAYLEFVHYLWNEMMMMSSYLCHDLITNIKHLWLLTITNQPELLAQISFVKGKMQWRNK